MDENGNSGIQNEDNEGIVITWDDSFAIALRLRALHPDTPLEDVSLDMIYRWTIALPGFEDDLALANERILTAIIQEWFEEANPL